MARLLARVGDPTGHTLADLVAKIGNVGQDLNAMIGYEGATSLAAKLTATRAGYLDAAISSRAAPGAAMDLVAAAKAGHTISGTKTTLDVLNDITAASVWAVATRALTDKAGFSLSAAGIDAIRQSVCLATDPASSIGKLLKDYLDVAISSRLAAASYVTERGTDGAALASSWTAALATVLGNYTTARAANLDNLEAAITNGSYGLPDGTTEQFPAVLTFASAIREIEIELDTINLTQNLEIKTYSEVDGVTYRQIGFKTHPTDFDSGTECVIIVHKQKNADFRIGLRSTVAEGAVKDIPYRIWARGMV